MIKNLKTICIASLIAPAMLLANTAIVNTNILLVKKQPSNKSGNNRYYEMNKVIEVQEEVSGLDNDDKWYKTSKGYVKAKYVLLDGELPEFLEEDEVDYSKNAIQLIVYKSTVVESLVKLRKILRDEDSIYLKESKNVYVIYLVNFDSYRDALNKSNSLKRDFTTNFVTKLRKQKKVLKIETKDKIDTPSDIEKLIKENFKDEEIENIKKNVVSKEEIDENLQDIKEVKKEEVAKEVKKEEVVKEVKKQEVVKEVKKAEVAKEEEKVVTKKEKIVLENKEVVKRPDNNGIKKVRSMKNTEKEQTKKVNNLNFEPKIKAPTYEQMLENILIELNK